LKGIRIKKNQGIKGIFNDMKGIALDINKISSAKGQIDMMTFPREYPYLFKATSA